MMVIDWLLFCCPPSSWTVKSVIPDTSGLSGESLPSIWIWKTKDSPTKTWFFSIAAWTLNCCAFAINPNDPGQEHNTPANRAKKSAGLFTVLANMVTSLCRPE